MQCEKNNYFSNKPAEAYIFGHISECWEPQKELVGRMQFYYFEGSCEDEATYLDIASKFRSLVRLSLFKSVSQ